jgi:hypothetical protein
VETFYSLLNNNNKDGKDMPCVNNPRININMGESNLPEAICKRFAIKKSLKIILLTFINYIKY